MGVIHFGLNAYHGYHKIEEIKDTLINCEGNITHVWSESKRTSNKNYRTDYYGIITFNDTNNNTRQFCTELSHKNISGETVTVYHNNNNIARLFIGQGDKLELIKPIVLAGLFFMFLLFFFLIKRRKFSKRSYISIILPSVLLVIFMFIFYFTAVIAPKQEIKNKALYEETLGVVESIRIHKETPPSTLISFYHPNQDTQVSFYTSNFLLTGSKIPILYNANNSNLYTIKEETDKESIYIFIVFALLMLMLLISSSTLGTFLRKYHII